MMRRAMLATVILLAIACLDPAGTPPPVIPGRSWANRTENARPGSPDWDADLYTTSDSRITGYASPFTALSGDTLHLFASAWSAAVTTSIYRLGWYDGVGARLVARHVNRPVATQAPCTPPVPGPSVCSWAEADRFVAGSDRDPCVSIAQVGNY